MEGVPSQYHPDHDLTEELRAVVNRHVDRCSVGKIFGSLMVIAAAAIRANPERQPTDGAVRGLARIAAQFLAQSPKKHHSILHLPTGYRQ